MVIVAAAAAAVVTCVSVTAVDVVSRCYPSLLMLYVHVLMLLLYRKDTQKQNCCSGPDK